MTVTTTSTDPLDTATEQLKGTAIRCLKAPFVAFRRFVRFIFNIVTWPFRLYAVFLNLVLEWAIKTAKTTVQKAVVAVLVGSAIVWMAVLMYATFYTFYLPTAEIVCPAHLIFSVCSSGVGICSFPSANVSFGDAGSYKVLGSGQVYKVMLELDLPDSPVNRNLGMFVVAVRMYDHEGQITSQAFRSAMARYRSIVMRMIDVLLLSPFYFLGLKDQQQTIVVEMFSHFVDDYYQPSIGAIVEVQSHQIQIYSAHLKLFASFSGLKYMLHYWPITSFFCGVIFNIILLTILTGVAVLRKVTSLQLIEQSLELKEEKRKEKIHRREESEALDQSSLTKSSEADDSESFDDLLTSEESSNFFDEHDTELTTELRQRRIN